MVNMMVVVVMATMKEEEGGRPEGNRSFGGSRHR
jgi:hypothetical protein